MESKMYSRGHKNSKCGCPKAPTAPQAPQAPTRPAGAATPAKMRG